MIVDGDTIIREIYTYRSFHQPQPTSARIYRDSLQPSTNCLAELCAEDGKLLISQPFVLRADSTTTLNLAYSVTQNVRPRIPYIEEESNTSIEFYAGMWTADSNRMAPAAWTAGLSFGYWVVINKHIGFVWDRGLAYKFGELNDDTSFAQLAVPGKISEYYSYLDFHEQVRLRFSTGNQYRSLKSGLLFDLGLSYHFPLYFRHVVKYDSQNKIMRQGIHDYTDFRAFAGIGTYQFTAYLEYRPFNHIKGDLPEMPPFMVGIKFSPFESW